MFFLIAFGFLFETPKHTGTLSVPFLQTPKNPRGGESLLRWARPRCSFSTLVGHLALCSSVAAGPKRGVSESWQFARTREMQRSNTREDNEKAKQMNVVRVFFLLESSLFSLCFSSPHSPVFVARNFNRDPLGVF